MCKRTLYFKKKAEGRKVINKYSKTPYLIVKNINILIIFATYYNK